MKKKSPLTTTNKQIIISFYFVRTCLASCRYEKSQWTECNPETNVRTRTLSLKKGDEGCIPTRTIQKKCKKGKYIYVCVCVRMHEYVCIRLLFFLSNSLYPAVCVFVVYSLFFRSSSFACLFVAFCFHSFSSCRSFPLLTNFLGTSFFSSFFPLRFFFSSYSSTWFVFIFLLNRAFVSMCVCVLGSKSNVQPS